MNTGTTIKSTYWLWEKGIPEELCDMAIRDMGNMKFSDGKIGGIKVGSKVTAIRKSRITFAEPNYWLEGIAYNYASYANRSADWNYKVDWAEPIQLAKYEKDHHYDWHEDWAPLEVCGDNRVRKLSVIILLSDSSEFTGGEFQFQNRSGSDTTIKMNKGSVLVFPSYVTHRVTPIISGTRYSAANWIVGKNTL